MLVLAAVVQGQTAREIEDVFWREVVCEDERDVQAYLKEYTSGAYVAEARACLAAIAQRVAAEARLDLDQQARIWVQRGLTALNHPVGAADGLFDPATRTALRQWQRAERIAVTGYLTPAQAATLIAAGREAEARRAQEAAARQAREAEQRRVEEAERQREANELVNTIGMEFVRIEAGTFRMGAPARRAGRSDDRSRYTVHISQPFYLGKYEVTQGQWRAVLGGNPSHFTDCGDTCPVENVSWEDAQAFIEELNLREGIPVYRLPTEAEWEYATRAGTRTVYSFGNTKSQLRAYGWYRDNSDNTTHPVGGKRPNGWGLYDLHGNVWELVADWYDDYPSGRVTDPQGPSSGTHRIIRGGGWSYNARDCRTASRGIGRPSVRSSHVGFRLARTP